MKRRWIAKLVALCLLCCGIPAMGEESGMEPAEEVMADISALDTGVDLSEEDEIDAEIADAMVEIPFVEEVLSEEEALAGDEELIAADDDEPIMHMEDGADSMLEEISISLGELEAAEDDYYGQDDPIPEPAQSVTLNKTKAVLYMGMTLQLKAGVTPETASQAVTWESSNTKIAKVSPSGLVTPVKVGKATITARTADGKKNSCAVTVKANRIDNLTKKPTASQIRKVKNKWTIQPKSMEFLYGGKLKLEFYLLNGTAKTSACIKSMKLKAALGGKIVAEHVFSKVTVKCKKNTYKVFSVIIPADDLFRKPFQLNQYKAGKYTFAVKKGLKLYAGKKVAYKPVKVKYYTSEVYVTKVAVNPANVTIQYGKTQQLKASVSPSDATDKSVTWSSSDPSVATVDNNGLVTGIKVGTATITAKSNDPRGKTGSCIVTVYADGVLTTSIFLDCSELYVHTGRTLPLTAYIYPNDASSGELRWTSADTSIATVDTTGTYIGNPNWIVNGGIHGFVTGVSEGETTVTVSATDGSGVEMSCVVVVGPPPILADRIELDQTEVTIDVNESIPLTAKIIPENATDQDVKWLSSNQAVATIDSDGVVTGHGAGTTTITARAIDESGAKAACQVTVISHTDNGWTFNELPDGTLEITGYEWADANVTIPAEINGKTVSAIADGAFDGNIAMEHVIVPGTIETIGDEAFARIPCLQSVTMREGVREIGDEAFQDCRVLESVTLPRHMDRIGKKAFQYCVFLNNIIFPTGIGEIPVYCFTQCKRLTTFEIPADVTTISKGAFYLCTGLKRVTVPDGVTTIGVNAFHECTEMEYIILPGSITEIDESAFSSCDSLTINAPESSTAWQFAVAHDMLAEPVVLESLHPYYDNTDETWCYEHPESVAALEITFSAKTMVEPYLDYICVIDSNGTQTRYTKDALAGKTLVLPGNWFSIRLISNSGKSEFGFRITGVKGMSEEEYTAYLADNQA